MTILVIQCALCHAVCIGAWLNFMNSDAQFFANELRVFSKVHLDDPKIRAGVSVFVTRTFESDIRSLSNIA